MSKEVVEKEEKVVPEEKNLGITDAKGAKDNIKDIEFFGNGDTFRLISKASSQSQGWMKSTKAMEIPDVGCVVQVTTQQRNPDGSYSLAEAVTFVPNTKIDTNHAGEPILKRNY